MVPRRRVIRALGPLAGALVAGCVAAPSGPVGDPSTPTASTGTADPDGEADYPTREGVRLGRASVELHPRATVEFTDDVARLRCTCVAADAVRRHVSGSIADTRGISVGCGRWPIPATPLAETGYAAIVHHATSYGREGSLLREPAVTYDRLRSVTPRTASATVESADRVHTCTVPVYVVREETHAD